MVFIAGESVFCPRCETRLVCVDRNYSGTGQDVGECPGCDRFYFITYKVARVEETGWE